MLTCPRMQACDRSHPQNNKTNSSPTRPAKKLIGAPCTFAATAAQVPSFLNCGNTPNLYKASQLNPSAPVHAACEACCHSCCCCHGQHCSGSSCCWAPVPAAVPHCVLRRPPVTNLLPD
jgi:hypothetical protein